MASLNKVMLIGNLGRNPEMKATPGGQNVARFSIATTETWKAQSGEKQSKTEWHNIVVWGKQAETVERFLSKGSQVMVEGRIQYREYTSRDGIKKNATEIRCDNFVMLGSKRDGNVSPDYEAAREYAQEQVPSPMQDMEDDIPF
jgi:single-strand DNA-binding protein